MAGKADLVEAHAFARRRLVAAFVSGAPGGREVEPARPGRTVLAGLALAVLLLAGAAIAGVFAPQPDIDWSKPGLVADSDSGALYVIVDDDPGTDEPRLRPVANVTSARLIVGDQTSPQKVAGATIAASPKGPPIGLVSAPATVPEPRALLASGWSACTGTGLGVRITVAGTPSVEPAMPSSGMVVRSGGSHWLVALAPPYAGAPAGVHRYPVPEEIGESIYHGLGVPIPDEAIEVGAAWLSLIPSGGPLDAEGLGLADAGAEVRLPGLAATARVGDWFEIREDRYVVTAEGPARLDDFAAEVLAVSDLAGHRTEQVEVADSSRLDFVSAPWAASRWPTEVLDGPAPQPGEEVCVVLDAEEDVTAVGVGFSPLASASAADVAAGEVGRNVEPGRGALVATPPEAGADAGTTYLVDDRGFRHPITAEARARLGYDDLDPVVLPEPWVMLFAEGVVLSPEAARCTSGAGVVKDCE